MARRSNPPPTPRVRDEWLRRVEAEYRSCAAAHHLTLWLIQLGAPPELIRAGLRISADELAHAQLSHAVFTAAGGGGAVSLDQQGPPGPEGLALPRQLEAPLWHDVLRAGVEMFCLGETVAVPLFSGMRKGATVAVARRALDRVLRDEVRHRDFGWTLLRWLLRESPWGAELFDLCAAELPGMLARVRQGYARPGDEDHTTQAAGEAAWGLLPLAEYGQVLQRTISRDYAPRFARLGLSLPLTMVDGAST